MSIESLVKKYISNRSYYISEKYNEALLRNDFLNSLFELLGWDIQNKAGRPTNEREVILEEPVKANVSETSKKPDYTFRLFSERKFFLEAKKPSIPIHEDDSSAKQIRRYGFSAKLKISVLSNFEYLLIYDCSNKVEEKDSFSKCLIKKYHYTEYPEKFSEIYNLIGKDSVYSGRFDDEWKEIEEKINQFSIDKLFLSQINEWRILLGTQIYKFQSDITEQLLNDYVQSYLNRIVFLRVCEDRNIEGYKTLLKFADESDYNALIKKFEQADIKYNSGLFDQILSDKIIGNISSVFWNIIHNLYYPESPYSFAVISSDILGSIYENFLSEKLVIEEGSIKLKKKPENIDKDIISTPTFIIKNILRSSVVPYCKDLDYEDFLSLKIADIACGSGSFLIELFQLLNDMLIDYFLVESPSKLIQTNIKTYKLKFETKKEILQNCIFGADKDFNAVETTKFGLLLKLLEGENTETLPSKNPVLPDLENNILFGNSLVESSDIERGENIREINPLDWGEKKFDIILGNPPYMKSEDMKGLNPLEVPIYKKKFATAYKQFDKYFLFIEQGLNLLKKDGILGYIVPNKFWKVGAGLKLREILQDNTFLKNIVSFGANQIFESKTTYTCLLILEKKEKDFFLFSEIKNLKKWKVYSEEERSFTKIKFSELNKDVWVLVPPYLRNSYENILKQSVPLYRIVGDKNIYNGIQTSANRVFIIKPIKEDSKFIYFCKDNKEWKIEKTFLKPYFKTSSGTDNLNTYTLIKPNSYVIYPYVKTEGNLKLIDIEILEKEYPFAYKYLMHYKSKLDNDRRDIRPKPTTEHEWYRYGRHQSLESFNVPQKIIVGVLAVGDKYAIDFCGTYISSGGTAGYCAIAVPEDLEYSIYYLQAILNSKYLEWFSFLLGEIFRGEYIARGTKVLKKLPIRKINFGVKAEKDIHDNIVNIQKDLIKLYGEIITKQKEKRDFIKLDREFKRNKAKLDDQIKGLYDLGPDDILIPSIEELYGNN